MADLKISALTSAGALAGTEPLPIVQGGSTKKTTAQDVANLKATPNIQQVTDVGFSTTNRLVSDDGAGSSTEIGNGYIVIATGNIGDVNIDASLVTASYVAKLPNKPTSPQTFAMLSDVVANPMTTGGDIIYGGASGVPTRLANGTAGQVLQSNGTTLAPSWAAAGGGGDVYLANDQTFTGENTFAIASGSKEPIIVTKGGNGAGIKVTKSSGSGDAIEVADGSVSIADETASTIAHFDGSKRIKSLATSTYPSLTELSYVKGVTSAIQTQLNDKQAKTFANCADGTAITGVTTNQYSKGLLIPANSRGANDAPQVEITALKTGSNGNVTIRMYWNTTNDLAGSPILLGTFGPNAANSMAMVRVLMIQVANGSGNATRTLIATGTSAIGWGAGGAAASTLAINWTIDGYLICAVQNTSALDSTVGVMVKLN
jgi:hypothetical protein